MCYVRFKRDSNSGKLDLEDDNYNDKEVVEVHVKFEKEIHLCLGCAIVFKDGQEEGKTAAPYDYYGKFILSIRDWETQKDT
jgi:hypothetical protein